MIHKNESPITLEIFRIVLGAILLYSGICLIPVLETFFGLGGIVPLERGSLRLNLFLVLPEDHITPVVLLSSWIFFSFTLMVGLWSRVSAFILYLVVTSFHHRNVPVLNSGDTVVRLFTFLLIFAPTGRLLSVDRVIRILRGKEIPTPGIRAPIFGLRLLQIQFSWIYVCATIHKLEGVKWRTGTALSTVLRIPEFQTSFTHYFTDTNLLTKVMTWASVLIEGLLATLIWVPLFRLPIAIAGILFHLSVELLMYIPLFEWIMMVGLILFIDAKYWLALGEKLKDKTPSTVLYDVDCTFCSRWKSVFESLDFRHSFQWRESPEAAEEAILIRPDGRRYGGYFAFKQMAISMPLLWPLLPLFFVPGSSFFGTRIYSWIAHHRYVFMGKRQVCETPPSKH